MPDQKSAKNKARSPKPKSESRTSKREPRNKSSSPAIRRVARELLGFDRLRPGQESAVRALLEGFDTLAVMPTGSGKSAIYQLAVQQLDGAAIIVSPLLALQRDQVDSIEENQAGNAALLNSALSSSEHAAVLESWQKGQIDFLFLAPEQFHNDEVVAALRQPHLKLFVVDEAHCISEWGHSFRPDYLKLGSVIESLGRPRVLALTATASPPVRREILARLSMQGVDGQTAREVVQGFDRPNQHLAVRRFESPETKREALREAIDELPHPGIIYVSTRRHAEEIAQELNEHGVNAVYYHAGRPKRERDAVQRCFMEDEAPVIVATNAFGMGVDKPNVRWVLHYDTADSLDSYYQEIGRAGRDGEPAQAVLFYCPADFNLHRFFASGGQLEAGELARVLYVVAEHGPITADELEESSELSSQKINRTLQRLQEAGALEMQEAGAVVAVEADRLQAVQDALEAQERRQQWERSRLEMMRSYAEDGTCRRAWILNYFGEPFQPPCGACDICERESQQTPASQDTRNEIIEFEAVGQEVLFTPGTRVRHARWGEGQVLRCEAEKIVVLFDETGYKTLAVQLVKEHQLLQPAA